MSYISILFKEVCCHCSSITPNCSYEKNKDKIPPKRNYMILPNMVTLWRCLHIHPTICEYPTHLLILTLMFLHPRLMIVPHHSHWQPFCRGILHFQMIHHRLYLLLMVIGRRGHDTPVLSMRRAWWETMYSSRWPRVHIWFILILIAICVYLYCICIIYVTMEAVMKPVTFSSVMNPHLIDIQKFTL